MRGLPTVKFTLETNNLNNIMCHSFGRYRNQLTVLFNFLFYFCLGLNLYRLSLLNKNSSLFKKICYYFVFVFTKIGRGYTYEKI